MPIDIKFTFVCRNEFAKLPGTSQEVRHCADCNIDVTNLDAMSEGAAHDFLQDAAARGQRVCVSATVAQPGKGNWCKPPVIAPTAGSTAPPSTYYLEISPPESPTAEQFEFFMELTGLPNRLAVLREIGQSPMLRFGPIDWRDEYAEMATALDHVKLAWSRVEVPWLGAPLEARAIVGFKRQNNGKATRRLLYGHK